MLAFMMECHPGPDVSPVGTNMLLNKSLDRKAQGFFEKSAADACLLSCKPLRLKEIAFIPGPAVRS